MDGRRSLELGKARPGLAIQAHAASAAGDALVAIAFAGTLFFDVPIDQARARLALYLLLTMTPFALLAPVIGPWVDRRRGGHAAAMAGAAAARAALALVMAAQRDSLLLYPVAFVVLVLARAHAISRSALVPTLAPPGELVATNAALARAAVIAGVLAAGPGILAQRLGGPEPTLLLAALAYLGATIAAFGLRRGRSTVEQAPAPVTAGGADGIARSRVRRARLANAALRALGGFLLFLLAFGLRRRGVGAAGFGLVLGATGLGSFLGAVVVPRLRRAANEDWMIAVALLLGSGAALIASRSFGTDLAALVAAAAGLAGSAGRLGFDSLVQKRYGARARGRVFARAETTFQIGWVAGALVPVIVPIGISAGLIVASLAYAATLVWFLADLGAEGRRRLAS